MTTATHEENGMWQHRQRRQWCSGKPRSAGDRRPPPGAGRGTEGVSPGDFGGRMALLTLWVGISRIQNCGRIYLYSFKPYNLWCLVTAAWDTATAGLSILFKDTKVTAKRIFKKGAKVKAVASGEWACGRRGKRSGHYFLLNVFRTSWLFNHTHVTLIFTKYK